MDALLDASAFYDISYGHIWAMGGGGTSVPDSPTAKRSRASALAEDGTLNPAAPRKTNDPKFREESFFDPRDICTR